MGKRQPYACPVQGCAKTGNLSGIKQHFREKHRRDIDEADLSTIIMKMEKITMGITIKKDAAPHLSMWQKIGYFAIGLIIGGLLTSSWEVGKCYFGLDGCPPAIKRVVHGS